MADVNRGQFVVVAELVPLVIVAGLALVVTSAIYAENVATRNTGSDSQQAFQTKRKNAIQNQRGSEVIA